MTVCLSRLCFVLLMLSKCAQLFSLGGVTPWRRQTGWCRRSISGQIGEAMVNSNPLRRFWTKETVIQAKDKNIESIIPIVDALVSNEKPTNLDGALTGMILIPKLSLIVPIQEGLAQWQHTTYFAKPLPENSCAEQSLQVVICGLAARAQASGDEVNEERPVNLEKKTALYFALKSVGLNSVEDNLLGEEFVGTPVPRIYRSFVCPRTGKETADTTTAEALDRHALRVANQILFAVRQVRADRSTILRNIDNASPRTDLPSGAAIGSDGVSQQATPPNGLSRRHPVVLVLDNLRSAENVGSVFRSAETASVAEVVTCGITPHPPHPKVSKTALQATELVPTRHFADPVEAVWALKSDGYTIVAMETTSRSQRYTSVAYPPKTAFVLGNEVVGVDTRIMEMADLIVEIPTYGVKNSLNVASAASVVLFETLRQWHKEDN